MVVVKTSLLMLWKYHSQRLLWRTLVSPLKEWRKTWPSSWTTRTSRHRLPWWRFKVRIPHMISWRLQRRKFQTKERFDTKSWPNSLKRTWAVRKQSTDLISRMHNSSSRVQWWRKFLTPSRRDRESLRINTPSRLISSMIKWLRSSQ